MQNAGAGAHVENRLAASVSVPSSSLVVGCRTARASVFQGTLMAKRSTGSKSVAGKAVQNTRRTQPAPVVGAGWAPSSDCLTPRIRPTARHPETVSQCSRSQSRNWLTRPAVNPNRWATSPVVSPNDSAFAIWRFRFDSVRNQAARSKRAAAVAAGPARRSSTSCSFQMPVCGSL